MILKQENMLEVNSSAPTYAKATSAMSEGYLHYTTMDGLLITSGTMEDGSSTIHHVPPYWGPVTTSLLAATMIIFMVCAFFGNSMVILVIARHRGMRTRTNMFLCSLAVADLLTAILLMPVALTTVLNGTWAFSEVFCQVNGFLMPLFFVASIHTLMYISVHKYVTITRPFSAHCMSRRRILCLIAAAWLWALLTGYVTVHGLNNVLYKPTTTQCGPDYPKDLRTYFHPLYMVLFNYLTPFIVMTFCYIRIFKEMKEHSVRMERTSNLEKDMLFRQQRRITVTLIFVLLIFVMSWTPYILYSVYTSALKDKTGIPTYLNAISYWFGYMNSAVNPVIYALRSKAFREGYRELWCFKPQGPISEATEPMNQHSTLQRLSMFIQNSLRVRSTLSSDSCSQQDGIPDSRKMSAGSLANFLIRPLSRKVSTSSLPESFRYATTSLPRLTREQRKALQASTQPIRHSDIYYPESTKLLGDVENGINLTNGFLKVDEETIETSLQSKPSPRGKKKVVISTSEVVINDVENTEELEDHDNVFIVAADIEEPAHLQPAPLSTPHIRVSDYENGENKDYKRQYHTTKSLSVNEDKSLGSQFTQAHRASSEANIQKATTPGYLRNLLRMLHTRSRDKMRSLSSSSPWRRSSSGNSPAVEEGGDNKQQATSLSAPAMRPFLRSFSEDHRGEQGLTDVDSLQKAASESNVLNNQNKPSSSRWWHKKTKRLELTDDQQATSVTSFTQPDEGARLHRAWSEKPRLLRSMSIEKLDPQSHRRSRSVTPSRNKRKKTKTKIPTENSRQKLMLAAASPDIEVDMASEMLKVTTQSLKRRSDCATGKVLYRSWSDPCIPFQLLEDKVSVHRHLRQHRHRSGQKNPDHLDIVMVHDSIAA